MLDAERLLHDLIVHVEDNYEGVLELNYDAGYFTLEIDKEVFVISVKKEKLEDWN